MNARADLVGKWYGRLQVLAFASTRVGLAYWVCLCDCGNHTQVSSCNLRYTAAKPVRSCGCLLLETAARVGRGTRVHGDAVAKTTEYRAWVNIQIRCYNPNASNWKYY